MEVLFALIDIIFFVNVRKLISSNLNILGVVLSPDVDWTDGDLC